MAGPRGESSHLGVREVIRRIDLYEQLQIENFAAPEKVRDAYRRMALKLHPDRGGSESQMKILNNIYETLTKWKHQYDAWLEEQLAPPKIVHPDMMAFIYYEWMGDPVNGTYTTTSGGFTH